MPATVTPSTSTDDETPERNRWILLVLGVLGAVSAVVAGAVIFSSGSDPVPPKDPVAQVRAAGDTLLVGASDAPMKVVVYEEFASAGSRTFELASRDFLRIEAAQGRVQVDYRPVALTDEETATGRLASWAEVALEGSPQQALDFHDLLFDSDPTDNGVAGAELVSLAKKAGVRNSEVLEAVGAPDRSIPASTRQQAQAAGVRSTPTVLVGGQPLTAGSPTELADVLQKRILEASRS